MFKARNQTKAAVLALLFSTVRTESTGQQSLAEIDEASNLDLVMSQQTDLESFIDGTESVLDSKDSEAQSQIVVAIKQEKQAEQQALKAEELMKNASDKTQRKLAKKKLNKAQKRLQLAQFKLQEVQKSFGAEKIDNEAKDSEDSSDDDSGLAQQTSQIDVAQEVQERASMKEFFKKSSVYKNFKVEEDKEKLDAMECLQTQEEIDSVKNQFDSLKKKYEGLQQLMQVKEQVMPKVSEPTATEVAKEIHETSHVKQPLMHTVPAPLDQQYEVPAQMRKPLIPENQRDEHDIRNIYNPNKYKNDLGNYIQSNSTKPSSLNTSKSVNSSTQMNATTTKLTQINPTHPTGLEPPPPDYQYEVPHQLKHPLNLQNQEDSNDLYHYYNPLKHLNHIGNYGQKNQTLSQINPTHPTGLEPPPPDYQYEVPHQLKQPLNWENMVDQNDYIDHYNPYKHLNHIGNYAQKNQSLSQINPVSPTGLEPPPKDQQYEVPHQMLKPIIHENRNGYNDVQNYYNPNKYDHTLGEYAQISNQTLTDKSTSKNATKQQLTQINPASPTGLEPPPKDQQYQVPHQMLKPIIHENRNGFNDVQNYYNPNKYDHTLGEYAQIANLTLSEKSSSKNQTKQVLTQINPVKPTGLEPPPKDQQYEVPHQMLKPIIHENRNGFNDVQNYYNPNKYDHTLGEYAQIGKQSLTQINPASPTGLEPPPKDQQYEVPHQMLKPLIHENRNGFNDVQNYYNPNKYDHTLGEYAQVGNQTMTQSNLVQINPTAPTGLEPPPPDYQYEVPHQLKQPLNWENMVDQNDYIDHYNPFKHLNHIGNYVQINPVSPTGLEPPPKDQQYEVPHQMLKPIIHENRNGFNDVQNYYNPNKYEHTLGEYAQVRNQTLAQVNPASPTGLEPPPKDQQYEVPHQMLKPIIHENRNGFNDVQNYYNPNKYDHTLGEYAQVKREALNKEENGEKMTKVNFVQINPTSPTGLEPPPKDLQYEVPHQMLKPIIHENRNGFNDVQNYYNPNKYDHTLGEYVEIDGSAKKSKKNIEDLSDSESSGSSSGSDSDSDSSDSDSSYSSDDEKNSNRYSTAQKSADQNKNQTIEIKITTSNQPNVAPTIEILNPIKKSNVVQKLDQSVGKQEATVNASKIAKKQVVIEKQQKVEQEIKQKVQQNIATNQTNTIQSKQVKKAPETVVKNSVPKSAVEIPTTNVAVEKLDLKAAVEKSAPKMKSSLSSVKIQKANSAKVNSQANTTVQSQVAFKNKANATQAVTVNATKKNEANSNKSVAANTTQKVIVNATKQIVANNTKKVEANTSKLVTANITQKTAVNSTQKVETNISKPVAAIIQKPAVVNNSGNSLKSTKEISKKENELMVNSTSIMKSQSQQKESVKLSTTNKIDQVKSTAVAASAPFKAQQFANQTIPLNKISNKLAKEIEQSLKFLDDDVYVAKQSN